MKSNSEILSIARYLLFLTSLCIPYTTFAGVEVVNLEGNRISILAEKQPLIEVLQAMSTKTGIKITTGKLLSELISCRYTDIDTEAFFRKLLTKHDHVFLYVKGNQGLIELQEIKIPGDQSLVPVGEYVQRQSLTKEKPEQSDFTNKKFDKEWFQKNRQDKEQLLEQIAAKTAKPEDKGLYIESLTKDSFLTELGLAKGDTIEDINGIPVRTARELVDALGPPVSIDFIGIKSIKPSGEHKSVYIHLESKELL